LVQVLGLALTLGDSIHKGCHDSSSYTAGGTLPTGFVLDRFKVSTDQINYIDVRVPQDNAIPPDEGLDLSLFAKFQGEIESSNGLPLRLRFSPVIGDHSPPTAKKNVRHKTLSFSQIPNPKLSKL
jgi:hypothetical protein